jgi:predicted O-methyltransferase YrrM
MSAYPEKPEVSSWRTDHFQFVGLEGNMLSVNGIAGFMMPGEVHFLNAVAHLIPQGGRYLEVGSFMGLSAAAICSGLIANNNTTAKVYCVDTWRGSEEHQSRQEIKDNQLYQIFIGNLTKAELIDFIVPIKKDSVEAAADFPDGDFDMIFIDGDHSYQGCLKDLEAWYPKLKKEGVFIGHDASPTCGVPQALKEFCEKIGASATIIPPPECHYIWRLV